MTSNQQLWATRCTRCGSAAVVPFEPARNREVFCRNCYQRRKATAKRRRSVDPETLTFDGFHFKEKGIWRHPRAQAYHTSQSEQDSSQRSF